MNSHLNIFKTYAKMNRYHQLENDLTRALAISLQEDALFFHDFLKIIFANNDFYNKFFSNIERENSIEIDIQKRTSQIGDFEHIFAITLSGSPMGDFWSSHCNDEYDPICDLVININDVCLIIEVKRNDVDCTSQVYNQVLNIKRTTNPGIKRLEKAKFQDLVTPFDLNWKRLMETAVKIQSFESSLGKPNRFLTDFISLIKSHNFKWLPETPIYYLTEKDKHKIRRRIESAINELEKTIPEISRLPYNDRLSISFPKPWAQEILLKVEDNGNLGIAIYPGNTKAQGYSLFSKKPDFANSLNILDIEYSIDKVHHIKFTSFQKYFAGLWFGNDKLKGDLYTPITFSKYAGRKKRGKQWDEVESLLDKHLDFNWKKDCDWATSIINSGKNQFDISFGYEISFEIPFNTLKELDKEEDDIKGLTGLIEEIYRSLKDKLLNVANG